MKISEHFQDPRTAELWISNGRLGRRVDPTSSLWSDLSYVLSAKCPPEGLVNWLICYDLASLFPIHVTKPTIEELAIKVRTGFTKK